MIYSICIAIVRLRLRLARAICPDSHQIVFVHDIETRPHSVVRDLIFAADGLRRGFGVHHSILINAAALIQRLQRP